MNDSIMRVFQILRQASPKWVSGESLKGGKKISRNVVWKTVEKLRRRGHGILSHPKKGYCLVRESEALLPERVAARLKTRWLGKKLFFFPEISSTNDWLFQKKNEKLEEGTVVFADAQRRGRGRLGRSWVTLPGRALAFSVLLKPHWPPSRLALVTLTAAVALHKALLSFGVRAFIKWPNDLRVNGKKIAGLLTEMAGEQDQTNRLVLGVGLNVNGAKRDFPVEIRNQAATLQSVLHRKLDRVDVFTCCLEFLEKELERLFQGEFKKILRDWEAACEGMLAQVRLHQEKETWEGQMIGVDADGALILRLPWGGRRRFLSGDLEIIGHEKKKRKTS